MINTPGPTISICIPAYNQTRYLSILLQSIEKQKFTDFDIILSDDSNTDDVVNLLGSFNFGSKLKYFRNQPSLGSPANWNAAIKKATGKYVKIMHHDDAFVNEDSLADMVSCIDANQYDYLFCDTKIENVKDPGQNRIHTIRKLNRLIKKPWLLFFGNSIGAPSTLLLKKELAADLYYDAGYIWLVDMEYYVRLFKRSTAGGNISKPLVITHEAMEQRLTSVISTDFDLQIKEQVMLYNVLVPQATRLTRFFMNICFVRLLFKAKARNRKFAAEFDHPPGLVRFYFFSSKLKLLYYAFYIFTRSMDLVRKILFY
jgi:glycosyltransferase involved in cell wall biosynthesis